MSREVVAHATPTPTLRAAACQSVVDTLSELEATESGLSSDEAAHRLARFGPNVLSSRTVTVFGVLVRQLRNPLLLLLLVAAAVSAATGDVTDGGIIAAIVVLSVGLGFVNEYRSEVAVAALHPTSITRPSYGVTAPPSGSMSRNWCPATS